MVPDPLPDPASRATLLDALAAGDLDAAAARLPAGLVVERVDNARAAEAVPVWRADPDGRHRFRFHVRTWDHHPRLVFGRWLDTLPLVAAAAALEPRGWASLNLGDEAHRPGLAFCARDAGAVLVPDCMFLATRGYRALRERFAAAAVPWAERRPALFWRGATSGPAVDADALPRVALCRLARGMGDRADVGLSAVTPDHEAAEPRLRGEGLLRPFVPPDALDRHRLHVDIDGNSNSWPGLFTKLLSGGAVLKVASPAGHRQWYYARLEPWTHYAPVRADLSDLAEVAERLLADDALARRIGAAGRALALSLTFEGEVARAGPRIAAAFRAG